MDPVTLALAAERGIGIHRATAIDDRHGLGIGKPLDPETIDPEFLPYLNAWRMFRVGDLLLGSSFFELDQRDVFDGHRQP